MTTGQGRRPAAPPRVLFAGGGTGGHLFPGIAVARALAARHPGARIVFAGTGRGIETRALAREGFAFERIRSAGVMGKTPVAVARAAALAPVTLLDAARILWRARPDLVVGLGGYSAGPVVLLAALARRPTMLLEQNAVPGLTNRLLAPLVRAAGVSFEATVPYFGAKAFVSGNPVRGGFVTPADAAGAAPRAGTGARLLVIGGSQGAHRINLAMAAVAPALAAAPERVTVTHQAGERDLEVVRDAYRDAGVEARVETFFDALDDEMRAADVILCRAGATTLAEVAAIGRPAVIVPLPAAANDHQRRNAAVMADAAAAEVVEETELETRLATCLLELFRDGERRGRMADAARRLARPDAVRIVVERAEQLMGRETSTGGTGC